MADSNFVQSSFLGGEWSAFAQGRSDLPAYRSALNVCRNSFPIEEGAWVRRSGTRFAATTLNGAAGRLIKFDFEQSAPYIMEFTNGVLRMFAVATQTSGLVTPLPNDFRLVTTNDNQQVSNISTANPAVVTTGSAHGWATGDQVQFLFATTVNAGFTPLLRARTFKITVTDTTHFSLADPISGANIDGSTLGWSAPAANAVIVVRMLALVTPYTAGSWATLRKVQAETQAVLLHGSYVPRNLSVSTLPTASAFASFALSQVALLDGPYLDPSTDGSFLTPTITPVSQGTLPSSAAWTGIAWNGTVFCAIASGGTAAATSPDGITWTARTLPTSANWSAITWSGTLFCAIASGGTAAATSADGITWVARTLPVSAGWSAITFGASVFCAVASGGTIAATSPDGITWTQRTLSSSQLWSGIAWSGTVFCAVNSDIVVISGGHQITFATSPDGITWTARTFVIHVSGNFHAIAWGGAVFCAPLDSFSAATSPDGINWTINSLPTTANWLPIAWNGTIFCVAASGSTMAATSPDGVTWTQQALSSASSGWGAIAAGGATFCIVGNINNISLASSFANFSFAASSVNSINGGSGFATTDVGRSIRLLSEPLAWFVGTPYVTGNAVKFNGVYYIAIASTTGNQPDISPTKWSISAAAAVWTWGTISTRTSASIVKVAIQGPAILYPSVIIGIWRLGVYSDTTGYPTCGTYYQGRLWLSGAVPNRVDASVANKLFHMESTLADGTVTDNSAISYTFNSQDTNPIFWMAGTNSGIVCGTQAGEWLISAPTAGPITPTNIHAARGTTYGCANVEPEHTQLTLSFVQRFNRKVLEYFPDVFSGRFTAPNLSANAKHLTTSGIQEIRYQQELLPVIWARMGNGSLSGATYERDNLFSSQPAKFIGWHRHDLGSARTIESIAVGPSVDGTLDTLAMVTNDPTTNVRHVELMNSLFDVNAAITSGWFCDDAVVPSGGAITGSGVNATLTFYGLWHLNGKTVTVHCGGVDVGDFVVANGSVAVPIDADVGGLFTSAYLASISSTTAYGAMGTQIEWTGGRLTVPAVVGFTYTSQGQILRPDAQDQTRSQTGPGLAKPRRLHQFGALLQGTQGISFGTDFAKLHAVQFKSAGGTKDLTALQLFSGIYWNTIDDNWGFDSRLCWQVSRPYPAAVVALDGFMGMTDR
jgi:hypothetical protein